MLNMNANQFTKKLTETKPGKSFVYFTGNLALVANGNREVKALRDIAFRMATTTPPLGFLCQRSVANGSEYIFQKAKG